MKQLFILDTAVSFFMSSTETAVERRRKDEQVRTTIHQKLVDTGEKERLKQLLRSSFSLSCCMLARLAC